MTQHPFALQPVHSLEGVIAPVDVGRWTVELHQIERLDL